MRTLVPLLLALALGIVLSAAPGCAESAAVSAGISVAQFGANEFIRGELRSAHVASFDATFHATLDALQDLRFEKIESGAGEKVGTLRAWDLGGRRIRVTVTKKTEAITEINIRVGAFGNVTMSRLILGAIQSRLPAQPFAVPEQSGY